MLLNEFIFLPAICEIYEDDYNISFLIIFIILFYFNFTLNDIDAKSKLDIDLIFKYFSLFFKTPNFLLNYIINILKKIYVYLVYFKYRETINFIKLTSKKFFRTFSILWRPLFKKTSYFGFFRSNRSKWIK